LKGFEQVRHHLRRESHCRSGVASDRKICVNTMSNTKERHNLR
jgi:hypothetical protein